MSWSSATHGYLPTWAFIEAKDMPFQGIEAPWRKKRTAFVATQVISKESAGGDSKHQE